MANYKSRRNTTINILLENNRKIQSGQDTRYKASIISLMFAATYSNW
jgi:hypothetical protein